MKKPMLLLALFGLIGLAWAADPFAGDWKLNLSRSRYDPPSSTPKSGTIKTEVTEAGYRSVGDGIDSNGREVHWESSPILDGKPHPVTGSPNHTYVATRINAHTITGVISKGETVVSAERSVVSADGKTLTITTTQRNSQGADTTSILVFNKQ